MTDIAHTTQALQGMVAAGDVELWVDQRGTGPDVLLLAGLGDPAEAWSFQLEGLSDRYRLTAFDNRGVGRSPMLPEGFTTADLADDAAALLRSLAIDRAHVLGFSGGSAVAQHLALRHPDLVRSLVLVSTWARRDAHFCAVLRSFHWLVDRAPSDRDALEAFLLWIYTGRAHEDGTVAAIVEEALAFEHPQPADGFHRQVETFCEHEALDRLDRIVAPALVIAGAEDILTPPRLSREVAEQIPGAEFVLLPGEAHQPFQESPEAFDRLVDSFWSRIEEENR